MTNYTMKTGHAYLTNGVVVAGSFAGEVYTAGTITESGTQTTVVVGTISASLTGDNPVIKIPKPLSPGDSTGEAENYIINLRRLTKGVTITGKLYTVHSQARDIYLANLETIFEAKGLLTLVVINNTKEMTYTVSLDKYEVKVAEGLAKYDITLNCTIGVEKGT